MSKTNIFVLEKANSILSRHLIERDLLKDVFSQFGVNPQPKAFQQAFGAGQQASAGVVPPAPTGAAPKGQASPPVAPPLAQGGKMRAAGGVHMGAAMGKRGFPVGTVHTWGDGRRMRKEKTGLWVPVDQHDQPIQGHAGWRVDPDEEEARFIQHHLGEVAGLAGEGPLPWQHVYGAQWGERRGVPVEGEVSEEQANKQRVKRGDRSIEEFWTGWHKVIDRLNPEKKLLIRDEIMRGGGYGIRTDTGELVTLSADEVMRPPANIIQVQRMYFKPAKGRGLVFSMSFYRPGMMANKEVFVGENLDEALQEQHLLYKNLQDGKDDVFIKAKVLGIKEPNKAAEKEKWKAMAAGAALSPEQQAVFDKYKQQEIQNHLSTIDLLQDVKGEFGAVFNLPQGFRITSDFVKKWGKPSKFAGSWEVYRKKHNEDREKKGGKGLIKRMIDDENRDYILHYDKKQNQIRYLHYQAAELAAHALSEHRGLLTGRQGEELDSVINKIKAKLGYRPRLETVGEKRVSEMSAINMMDTAMKDYQGGVHKLARVKDKLHAYWFQPMDGELKGNAGGIYIPRERTPEYEKGDVARKNVAYYQLAQALARAEHEEGYKAAWAKEKNRLTGKGMAPTSKDEKAFKDKYMSKTASNWNGLVAETVMQSIPSPNNVGNPILGSLQASLQNRRVGNGHGFDIISGANGVGRDRIQRDKMARVLMLDLTSRNLGRNGNNTAVDSDGNVMAVDNGTSFSALGTQAWNLRNLEVIADHKVDSGTINLFKNMTPEKLVRYGMATAQYDLHQNPTTRNAITHEDLILTAKRMNGLGMFLEKNGGQFPPLKELEGLDRLNPEHTNKPLSALETYVDGFALKEIALGNTPYFQKLYAAAKNEYGMYVDSKKWVEGGRVGEPPPPPLMPPVYYKIMDRIRQNAAAGGRA